MKFQLEKFALLAFFLAAISACAEKPEQKVAPPAITVGVLRVDRGDIEQTLEVSGQLVFVSNTTISAEISAQVQSIEVVDGQLVKKGDVLLIFDETKIRETANQARANLQKDEATLAYARTEWEKNKSLRESGSISQSQFDQKVSAYQNAFAQVEADKAGLAKALEDLKKTKVIAPFDGVVSNRYVERGDWVSEGGKLFLLSDYRKIYLEAFISDLDVGKIDAKKILTEGLDVTVTVDAYPGAIFKGKMTYIQPVANQGRLFQTRIYLDNEDMTLLQGLFARGQIVVRKIPGVTRIPVDALLEQIKENYPNTVFTVDAENKASLNRIKVGAIDQIFAEVIDGLKPGQWVVVRGKEILNSGQPLRLTELPRPQRELPAAWARSISENNISGAQ